MSNASSEYLRNAVMTASPEQLHLMLYDGAIRFTRAGIEAIERRDWEGAFNGFSRAQKIVLEMLNALNYDIDEDLCKRMGSLYNFIYQRLVESSVQRDVAPARDALRILEYQRETWVLLIERLAETAGEAGGARTGFDLPGTDRPEAIEADPVYGPISFQG